MECFSYHQGKVKEVSTFIAMHYLRIHIIRGQRGLPLPSCCLISTILHQLLKPIANLLLVYSIDCTVLCAVFVDGLGCGLCCCRQGHMSKLWIL